MNMEKKLFTQLRNEWRSNLWLAVELLVVSVVMWYVVDLLYVRIATFLEPRGFDTEHCYLVQMEVLTGKQTDYQPYNETHKLCDEVRELAERLRHRPEVEAVSLSQNSYPYNGSNSGADVTYDTLQSPRYVIRRMVTPDFVRVFRYRGTRGETPEQLAAMLEKGELLASDNLYEQRYGIRLTSLVGKDGFVLDGDTTHRVRLGAALQNVRYHDYEQGFESNSIVFNLNLLSEDWINDDNELCIRVKEGEDRNFIENLKADSEKLYRVGNLYISDVRSFQDLRRNFQQIYSNELRNYLFGMGFLLLNIFLGLLGTFWFRTQQRRKEIALHKALGATDGAIFRRLLMEGFLLLGVITPLALGLDTGLAYFELNSWRNGTTLEVDRLLCCALGSALLIALMIAVGIGIPARKAMKIQPAVALHDE